MSESILEQTKFSLVAASLAAGGMGPPGFLRGGGTDVFPGKARKASVMLAIKII